MPPFLNKYNYGGDIMKKYIPKKKVKSKKTELKGIRKLSVSIILFAIVVFLCSLNNSFGNTVKSFVSHNLKYNIDFGALADKTEKFATECINYYKSSEIFSDDSDMEDGEQK